VHLTPTTLELGASRPASGFRLRHAAGGAARGHGKLLNAGQTCIAPDYVLLPRGQEAAFEQAYRQAVAQLFPRIVGNPDYASIIHQRHLVRLAICCSRPRAWGPRCR
jgi:coniferyl-aldehyde dehydrogenase